MDPAICRDCLCQATPGPRCPACGSPRVLRHAELHDLAIAHIDADAFYAAIEKRDDPGLADRPVIIGGGRRGVVSTACYLARLTGVRSAMPMFKALKLCPDAVIIKPRMAHYVAVSGQLRELMLTLTPLVEPLSLDEAFLDLSGTERLHGASPAVTLVRLQERIGRELGISVSVGLSHNKFLAKIASEQEKPRGFAIIGRAETGAFLARQPISLVWGVGPAAVHTLNAEGIRTIGDLLSRERQDLLRRFGSLGDRLWSLAQGRDPRPVSPDRAIKSISHETTFNEDLADFEHLAWHLWSLAEQVSARAKARSLSGRTVTLKLKRADHTVLARRRTLAEPSQLADVLYRAAEPMLRRDMTSAPFRLIGIGLAGLLSAEDTGSEVDLLDPTGGKRHAAERTADRIRARFGNTSVIFGRSVR